MFIPSFKAICIIVPFSIILFLLCVYSLDSENMSPSANAVDPTLKQYINLKKVPDFSAISDVKTKKYVFFEYMYHFVEKVNYEVYDRRVAIEAISKKRRDTLTKKDIKFIKEMSALYLKNDDASDTILTAKVLLHHVRVIPPSLALAQAANESAWGVSRFASDGHNYFGQWCFDTGCGFVPQNRGAGQTHEVRKFNSPESSVRSYIRNLNTHDQYKPLRDIRYATHQTGVTITGLHLAKGLSGYSERGNQYTEELESMIRKNNLIEFDKRFWTSVKERK